MPIIFPADATASCNLKNVSSGSYYETMKDRVQDGSLGLCFDAMLTLDPATLMKQSEEYIILEMGNRVLREVCW